VRRLRAPGGVDLGGYRYTAFGQHVRKRIRSVILTFTEESSELDKNGNPKRLPGHILFNAELWEDIGDILLPGPVVPDFILHPERCGDNGA
jgi:hypothetical protein